MGHSALYEPMKPAGITASWLGAHQESLSGPILHKRTTPSVWACVVNCLPPGDGLLSPRISDEKNTGRYENQISGAPMD